MFDLAICGPDFALQPDPGLCIVGTRRFVVLRLPWLSNGCVCVVLEPRIDIGQAVLAVSVSAHVSDAQKGGWWLSGALAGCMHTQAPY